LVLTSWWAFPVTTTSVLVKEPLSIFFSDVLSSPLLRLAPLAAAAAHGFCISFDAYKQLGKLLHMQQAWLSTMHRFEGQMGALAPQPPSLRTAEAPGCGCAASGPQLTA